MQLGGASGDDPERNLQGENSQKYRRRNPAMDFYIQIAMRG